MYEKQTKILFEKNIKFNEKWLFYAKKNIEPKKIYNGGVYDDGYSYFSNNPVSIINEHSYESDDGLIIYYTRVALEEDHNLDDKSNDNYIIVENSRFYPQYIITIKE